MERENNFIIQNGNEVSGDQELFFPGEDVTFLPDTVDIYDILVRVGIFPSKSQARKNWNKTGKEIPEGFSHFDRVGKLNKTITILNPTFRKERKRR